jgi:4-hydroxy-tetrahydrodipicolinate synthase
MKPLKKYYGIIPPVITPIDDHERVDEDGFRKLIDHCIQGGLHGIFVAGTNGEAMALTQKERNRAIAIALDQVKGRIPVLCGVMDSGTSRVIENIKALEQMGGTCAVVTSIFYARHTSQSETIRHFEKISRETETDLVVYNIPSMTGLTLSPGTVLSLGKIDKVCAYKDSSPDFPGFLKVLEEFRDTPVSCLQGMTALAIPALLMGADGFVPALAPLFPEIFVNAFEVSVHKGDGGLDMVKVLAYERLIRETSKILSLGRNMTAAAKYALASLGFTGKRILMPQDELSPEEENAILAQIDRVRELYNSMKQEG